MSTTSPTADFDQQSYYTNLKDNKPRSIKWLQYYIFLKIIVLSLLTLATGFVVLYGKNQLTLLFFAYAAEIIYNIAVYKAIRNVKYPKLVNLYKFLLCLATFFSIVALLITIFSATDKALHYLFILPFNFLELYLIFNKMSGEWFHRFTWFYQTKNKLAETK